MQKVSLFFFSTCPLSFFFLPFSNEYCAQKWKTNSKKVVIRFYYRYLVTKTTHSACVALPEGEKIFFSYVNRTIVQSCCYSALLAHEEEEKHDQHSIEKGLHIRCSLPGFFFFLLLPYSRERREKNNASSVMQ